MTSNAVEPERVDLSVVAHIASAMATAAHDTGRRIEEFERERARVAVRALTEAAEGLYRIPDHSRTVAVDRVLGHIESVLASPLLRDLLDEVDR